MDIIEKVGTKVNGFLNPVSKFSRCYGWYNTWNTECHGCQLSFDCDNEKHRRITAAKKKKSRN